MPESKFCPKCFSKNEPSADYCAYCQAPLRRKVANIHTTARVSGETDLPQLNVPCKERAMTVPYGGFALLIMNEADPLLAKPGETHILGRFDAGSTDAGLGLVDLSAYDAMELGVSRQHAEIRFTDVAFVLRDLGSTNGTWLNQTRLSPETPYVLHSNDQIVLGRLVVWICLGEEEAAPPTQQQRTRFALQVAPSLPGGLAVEGLPLERLRIETLPYLEALAAVQKVLDGVAQRPLQPVLVQALRVGETAFITLEVSGLDQAVQAVRDHLTTWRNRHPDLIGADLNEYRFLLEAEFTTMATAILDDHTPYLTPEQTQKVAIALRPWLEQLAVHPLEIGD